MRIAESSFHAVARGDNTTTPLFPNNESGDGESSCGRSDKVGLVFVSRSSSSTENDLRIMIGPT